jgi:uncharacterized membrane protein
MANRTFGYLAHRIPQSLLLMRSYKQIHKTRKKKKKKKKKEKEEEEEEEERKKEEEEEEKKRKEEEIKMHLHIKVCTKSLVKLCKR